MRAIERVVAAVASLGCSSWFGGGRWLPWLLTSGTKVHACAQSVRGSSGLHGAQPAVGADRLKVCGECERPTSASGFVADAAWVVQDDLGSAPPGGGMKGCAPRGSPSRDQALGWWIAPSAECASSLRVEPPRRTCLACLDGGWVACLADEFLGTSTVGVRELCLWGRALTTPGLCGWRLVSLLGGGHFPRGVGGRVGGRPHADGQGGRLCMLWFRAPYRLDGRGCLSAWWSSVTSPRMAAAAKQSDPSWTSPRVVRFHVKPEPPPRSRQLFHVKQRPLPAPWWTESTPQPSDAPTRHHLCQVQLTSASGRAGSTSARVWAPEDWSCRHAVAGSSSPSCGHRPGSMHDSSVATPWPLIRPQLRVGQDPVRRRGTGTSTRCGLAERPQASGGAGRRACVALNDSQPSNGPPAE